MQGRYKKVKNMKIINVADIHNDYIMQAAFASSFYCCRSFIKKEGKFIAANLQSMYL